MKNLIFVFGIDIQYGVEECYCQVIKATNLIEALEKLLIKENIDNDEDSQKDLNEFIEDGFVDFIEIYDYENDKQIRYMSVYDVPETLDELKIISNMILKGKD